MVSEDKFFAWLDGELAEDEAAQVAAEVHADPELAHKADAHRAMQARLASAFAGVADATVPDRLSDLVHQSTPEIIDFAAAKASRQPRKWASLPPWAALAATLAVGIFAGTLVPQQRSDGPIAIEGAKMFAAADLDRALDTQLASAPAGAVRIGVTFRDHGGAICRTFTDSAASGLACRSGDKWQVRGLFAAPEGQAGGYRMAAGMDPGLASLIGSAMSGEPFDAVQEQQSRDKGWR